MWDAMIAAGTPCPIDGKIGAEAKEIWDANPHRIPGNPPKAQKVSMAPVAEPVKEQDEKVARPDLGNWISGLFRSE